MIRAALANAQAAEVDNFIRFDVQDAQAARPNGEHGIMIFQSALWCAPCRNSGFAGALSATGHMVETALRRLAGWDVYRRSRYAEIYAPFSEA